jgi:GH24 family phage-related lysozyme (muramidase)
MYQIKTHSPDSHIQVEKISTWNEEFKIVIDYIKEHEGFSPYPMDDVGYLAIGYGCRMIYLPDSIQIPMSKEGALYHLKSMFYQNLDYVEYNYPELEGCQLLAIAHLAYAVGIGTVVRSGVYRDGKLNKWKLYNLRRGIDNLPHFRKLREFEYELFNKANYTYSSKIKN